jgi:WS/DGAT/MGAT family acyltransferase
LFDLEPEPAARPLVDPGDVAQAGGKASPLQLALRGLRNASQRPRALRRHLRRTAAAAYAAVRSHGIAGIANAPRVSFNGDVGPRRAVRWTSVSLAEVKALKNRHDVTLNDVVLALTGSALRRYLLQRGELPATPLSVMIPISTRTDGDDSLGNQVSQASLPWATNLADPVERLLSLHEDAERAKKTASATGSNLMAALGESLPPYLTQLLIRASAAAPERTPLPANAVVSNVRCTEVPLYIAGARIDRLLPVSVLAPGQGLNITVLSYCGELHFGITADPDLVPELALIADGIPKALTELWEATANPAARAEGDDELSGSEVRPAA